MYHLLAFIPAQNPHAFGLKTTEAPDKGRKVAQGLNGFSPFFGNFSLAQGFFERAFRFAGRMGDMVTLEEATSAARTGSSAVTKRDVTTPWNQRTFATSFLWMIPSFVTTALLQRLVRRFPSFGNPGF